MKVKCEYCGSFISDTDPSCPNCGAPNERLMRSAVGIPKTVDQLKAFCASRNMPLERMRFFIGEDCREPRAFGVYREADGDFVVYKNKADGSRAVRYRGKDEAYAVNELYQKLKSEVSLRRSAVSPASRSAPAGSGGAMAPRSKKRLIRIAIILAVLIVLSVSCTRAIMLMPDRGYYSYDGSYYYNDLESWYRYDSGSGQWFPDAVDPELNDNYGDYWQSSDYDSGYPATDFYDGQYADNADNADNGDSWDSDWDSGDWDYDYDSWDSGGTDWDSDW